MREIINRPWGEEEIIVQTPRYVVKKIFIKAGLGPSRHFYLKKDKTIYIDRGVLHLDFSRDRHESNVRKMVEGESWHLAPKTVHKFIASEEGDVVLFEISTPEVDDVIHLFDVYGDASA